MSYRPAELGLVERVQGAISFADGREYDVFLNYFRIDGEAIATELARVFELLGVRVWFDAVAIQPDLAGFTTADDEVATISEKIAPFVRSSAIGD